MPTKRVEGRKKKKSIKAKIRPNMGSKQRTMRLGGERKKGDRGAAAAYLSRAQILRRLQLSLKDFRRLCILKGIYPRDPPRAVSRHGKSKTYYHVKDVQYLAHEPLIDSFRKFKAFMKKLKRTIGRGERYEAERRERVSKPTHALDHLVKERYPRFIDALRDLDDALSLIHLFAALPQVKRDTSDKVEACQRMVQEWQLYCTHTRCLKKVFVSIKGIYFQCNIQGQPVMWISPHAFSQHYPKDVDFSIMLTFLDFYLILLRFIMYRLFSTIGFRYPPRINEALYNDDAGLIALRPLEIGTALEDEEEVIPSGIVAPNTVASIDDVTTAISHDKNKGSNIVDNAAVTMKTIIELDSKMEDIINNEREVMKKEKNQLLLQEEDQQEQSDEGEKDVEEEEEEEEEEDNEVNEDTGLSAQSANDVTDTLHKVVKGSEKEDNDGNLRMTFASDSPDDTNVLCKIFEGLYFYLGREVPRQWVSFTILSCGGKVGWEGQGSPYCENSDSITHHVVDRPHFTKQPISKRPREYIQPQWIFDCINTGMRLPVERYNAGATLPPHLSPFVDDEEQGYVPQYREELRRLRSGMLPPSSISDDKEEKKSDGGDNDNEEEEGADDGQSLSEDEETVYARELVQESIGVTYSMAGHKATTTTADGKKKRSGVKDNKRKHCHGITVGDDANNIDGASTTEVDQDAGEEPQHDNTDEIEHNHELARTVMGKKAKRLYNRMQHGISKKKEKANKLKEKRESIKKHKQSFHAQRREIGATGPQ